MVLRVAEAGLEHPILLFPLHKFQKAYIYCHAQLTSTPILKLAPHCLCTLGSQQGDALEPVRNAMKIIHCYLCLSRHPPEPESLPSYLLPSPILPHF